MNFPVGQHPRGHPPQLAVNLRIIGLGGAGGIIVDRLAAIGLGESGCDIIDTDAQALQRIVLAGKMTIGVKRTRGLGCGGDSSLGRQCMEAAKRSLIKKIDGADVVLLVVGLGGGLGTGAASVLASTAHENGSLVIALALMPFECEGHRRIEQARSGLKQLRETADAVVCLANQHVLELHGEDKTAQETFEAANTLVLQGAVGIGRLLKADGLLTAGLADLRAVLDGRNAESALAAAEAIGRNRHRALIEQLRTHPFMEKGRVMKEADALLVSLVGGEEMTMADVNRVMKHINTHCPNAEIVLSAEVDTSYKGKLGISVITARGEREFESTALPVEESTLELNQVEESVATKSPVHSRKAKQQELELQSVSKGRFEKSEPTLYHGEDLDVPTFIRRNLALK